MTMDREKEREIELESAMYTNCLLLGLDPTILGVVGGSNGTPPRVGNFRHSNPKLGEQLLYFILSSLRGPIQSSKVPILPFFLLWSALVFFFFSVSVIWFFLGIFRISIRCGQSSTRRNRGIFGRWNFIFHIGGLGFFWFLFFGGLKFEIFVWDFGWLGCARDN